MTVTRTPIGVEEGIELQEHDEYEGEEDQEGSQEKKSSNRGEMLKKGARMGGKALGAGYTAVNQARKTAAKAAVVGVGRAAVSYFCVRNRASPVFILLIHSLFFPLLI